MHPLLYILLSIGDLNTHSVIELMFLIILASIVLGSIILCVKDAILKRNPKQNYKYEYNDKTNKWVISERFWWRYLPIEAFKSEMIAKAICQMYNDKIND